jgi:hypothetical protein
MKLWNFSVLGKATDSSLNMQNTRGETVRPMRTDTRKIFYQHFSQEDTGLERIPKSFL